MLSWVRRTGPTTALVFAAGIGQVLTATLYILAARGTTPAAFGVVVVALALAGWGIGIVDYGASGLAARELAADRMTIAEFWSRYIIKMTVAVTVAALVVALGVWLSGEWAVALVGIWACARLSTTTLNGNLQAHGRYGTLAVTGVAESGLALAIFLPLARTVGSMSALVIAICLAAAAVTASLIGLVLHRDQVRRSSLGRCNPWRGSHGFGTFTLAVMLTGLDVVVGAAFGTAAAVGEYGAVRRAVTPLILVAGAVNTTTMRDSARARSVDVAFRRITLLWPFFVLAFVMAAGLVAASATLVPLLLGEQYASAAPALSVLAVGAALSVVSGVLAVVLQSQGHERFVGYGLALVVGLQLVAVGLLVGPMGSIGIAIAYTGMQALFLTICVTKVLAIRPGSGPAEKGGSVLAEQGSGRG